MLTEKIPAIAALGAMLGLLLLGGCKAPSLGISFCKLTTQLAEADAKDYKKMHGGAEIPPGVACTQVFHSKVPYCRQIIGTDEPVMDEALAFDSVCDEPALGFQHFYFIAIDHGPAVDGTVFTTYHFLSFYERKKGGTIPPPGSDVDVVAENEATVYSGTFCPDGYVHMHHNSVYAKKKRRQSEFNGNNAKATGRHETDWDFWVTSRLDTLPGGTVHRRIASLDRIVRRTTNNISDKKPLVFNFENTLGVPRILFKEAPVYTCQRGPLCDGGNGRLPFDLGLLRAH